MKKVISVIVTLLLTASVLTAFSLTNTIQPAFACTTGPDGVSTIGCNGSVGGNGNNTGGGTGAIGGNGGGNAGGGNTGGGSTGGNGSGGTTSPPPYMELQKSTITSMCWGGGASIRDAYPANTGMACSLTINQPNYFAATCPAQNGNTPAMSITFYQEQIRGAVAGMDGNVWWNKAFVCNYPPYADPNTILGSKQCFISYDASLYQSSNRDAISTGGTQVVYRGPGGAGASPNPRNNIFIGPANYDGCVESAPIGQEFKLNTPENGGFGYYKMNLNDIKITYCYYTGFPLWANNGTADKKQCTGNAWAPDMATYAVNACNYNFIKYGSAGAMPSGVNFGISACSNFQCVVNSPTTVNGVTGDVEVMRNGANVPVKFATIRVDHDGGVKDVRNVLAKTTVVAGSTPMNGENVNGADQYFKLKDKTGNTKMNFGVWENQDLSDRNLSFYWAGDTGKPFKMDRNFMFTASFLVPVASNTSGNWSNVWQTETLTYQNGSPCASTSGPISVLRSVNY